MQNDPSILVDPHIKVKLTGDGTRISRSMHTIVTAFTILKEVNSTSPSGSHVVAIFNGKEKYDTLHDSLHDLIEEIKDLEVIMVNETFFKLNGSCVQIGNF